MMKRKVLLLISIIAAVSLSVGCALAADADPIVCNMEIDPPKLAGPGTVNVTITISNSGDTDMKDPVVLYDPAAQIVSDFGTNGAALLKAGDSITWTGSYDVNQRTLDNGSVVYFVKYNIYKDSGEAVETSQPIRGKISVQTAEADIDVKRTISPTVAREGQKVVVKYNITNSGTVDLTDITIQEHKDVHKEKQTIPELKAGQTAEIEYTVSMGKKNLTSGATVTYKSAGSKKAQEYTVENQTIAYGESSLSAKLTSSSKGVPVNEKVTLTLELKNGGTLDYSDIRVTDPTLGDVFSNQKLEAGKSLKLEKEITLPATSDYQFTITAIDSSGTETVTATDAVTVTAVNPEDVLKLTLTATPDRTEVYEQPGLVRFSLSITNDSSVDAKKVVVKHGNTAIYTFESIPAGETRKLTRDTALSMAGKYRFSATAQDALENSLTFESNEVQIAFSVPTPAPATATPPPVPTAEPTFSAVTMPPIADPSIGAFPKTVQNILLPILILAGLMLIVSAGLLIVATKRRADQRKASEAAFDHLERAKRRDYITPAEEEDALAEEGAKEAGSAGEEPKAKDPAMEGRRTLLDDDDVDELELPHMKYARGAVENKTPEPEDDFSSAIGEGLYDEELTSDLTAYDSHPEDAVMYEQPYEDDDDYEGPYEGDPVHEADVAAEIAADEGDGAFTEDAEVEDGPYEQAYDDLPDGGYDGAYDEGPLTAYEDDGYDLPYEDGGYAETGYEDGGEDGYDSGEDDSEPGADEGGDGTAADDDSRFRRPEPSKPPRPGRRSRSDRGAASL